MTVKEMINVLSKFPEDEEIFVLFLEDSYGEDRGASISEVAYITGTKNVRNGVFIKRG